MVTYNFKVRKSHIKILFSLYIFTVMFFFLTSFNTKANSSLYEELSLFGGKIFISSNHAFSNNNKVYWTSNFLLTGQKSNLYTYKLENKYYIVLRNVTVNKTKINIVDSYINKTNKKIGILTDYKFKVPKKSDFLFSGQTLKTSHKMYDLLGENPQLIIKSKKSSFGIYFKDLFSKLNTKVTKLNDKELSVKNINLVIKPNEVYKKSFDVHLFNKEIKYFDYVNFLRKELNVISKVDGNFFFIDPYLNRKIFEDTKKLESFIKNYGVKYLLVTPWLDYSNFNFYKNKKYTRQEIKKYFIKIKKIIKSINPDIKLLVPLQSNVVDLNYEVQRIIKSQNKIKQGFNFYEIDTNVLIKKSKLNLKKEELVFDENNKILFETYYHDAKYGEKNLIEISLALKAYDNGYLIEKLKNQINFVIDELNFDGIYIDQFNQYFISPKHLFSYGGHYNNVGKIDITSGNIIKEYENISLNSLAFKEKLLKHAYEKTDYLFVNTHHIHDELRQGKIKRFAEGFWYFWAAKMWEKKSRDFFLAKTFFRSHLSTPISLSLGTIQGGDWKKNAHNSLVKNLRFCLFNGNLMYFLEQDISKLNLEIDKTNVFQKIYPINIREIHQGKIIGEKKIITLNDITVPKNVYQNYNFLYFDENGYIKENKTTKISYLEENIIIKVDQDEILILEKK